MTFKHVKFEDSPTMRALEKVAREKGLIKPEPLTKKASLVKKADLTPTNNLMQNVVKLCAGLREQGLVKDAAELETKYLQYKQAQTLYETSKETGEDVVEQAHPDGSHKLENVDSAEALIETILDQHKKDKEVVEKDPKGNLSEGKKATSMDVIRAVKKALGEDGLAEIKGLAGQASKLIDQVVNESNPELTFSAQSFADNVRKAVDNPTVYVLNQAISSIGNLHHRLDPSIISGVGYGFSGVSDYTWGRVQPWMNQAVSKLREAVAKRKEYDAGESSKIEGGGAAPGGGGAGSADKSSTQADPSLAKINQAKQGINGIAGLVAADTTADPGDVRDVNAWIAKIRNALKTLEDNYKSMSPEDVDAALAKITKDFATVRQEWA